MDFTFAQLVDYLDGRFAQQEERLTASLEVRFSALLDKRFNDFELHLDEKLDIRFDAAEGRMMAEFANIRTEMHTGFAAVVDTISRGYDLDEKRYGNHERRIVRLEHRST